MKSSVIFSLFIAFAILAPLAHADRDPVKTVYELQKLDPAAGTITTYEVDALDETVTPDALGKLKEEEQVKAIEDFIKKNETKVRLVRTEKAAKKASTRESRERTATPQNYFMWEGYGGNCFGYSYNQRFLGNPYTFDPYWVYGQDLGFHRGGWVDIDVNIWRGPVCRRPIYSFYRGRPCRRW